MEQDDIEEFSLTDSRESREKLPDLEEIIDDEYDVVNVEDSQCVYDEDSQNRDDDEKPDLWVRYKNATQQHSNFCEL